MKNAEFREVLGASGSQKDLAAPPSPSNSAQVVGDPDCGSLLPLDASSLLRGSTGCPISITTSA